MSARLDAGCVLRDLQASDLDQVLAIEQQAYEFPWSRDNFLSSLKAGYWLSGLWSQTAELLAYMIVMPGVQELHLLNLAVRPSQQGQGLGNRMLDALSDRARQERALNVWLEVRLSNQRAQQLYRRHAYVDVHIRKRYYPSTPLGSREDALIMRLQLVKDAHDLD